MLLHFYGLISINVGSIARYINVKRGCSSSIKQCLMATVIGLRDIIGGEWKVLLKKNVGG